MTLLKWRWVLPGTWVLLTHSQVSQRLDNHANSFTTRLKGTPLVCLFCNNSESTQECLESWFSCCLTSCLQYAKQGLKVWIWNSLVCNLNCICNSCLQTSFAKHLPHLPLVGQTGSPVPNSSSPTIVAKSGSSNSQSDVLIAPQDL